MEEPRPRARVAARVAFLFVNMHGQGITRHGIHHRDGPRDRIAVVASAAQGRQVFGSRRFRGARQAASGVLGSRRRIPRQGLRSRPAACDGRKRPPAYRA
jgi:hypothetical protein